MFNLRNQSRLCKPSSTGLDFAFTNICMDLPIQVAPGFDYDVKTHLSLITHLSLLFLVSLLTPKPAASSVVSAEQMSP